MTTVDEAKRELERQRANKREEEHRAKLKARHDAEREANRWAWIRHFNTLARNHRKIAERYEERCDELLERGEV